MTQPLRAAAAPSGPRPGELCVPNIQVQGGRRKEEAHSLSVTHRLCERLREGGCHEKWFYFYFSCYLLTS